MEKSVKDNKLFNSLIKAFTELTCVYTESSLYFLAKLYYVPVQLHAWILKIAKNEKWIFSYTPFQPTRYKVVTVTVSTTNTHTIPCNWFHFKV